MENKIISVYDVKTKKTYIRVGEVDSEGLEGSRNNTFLCYLERFINCYYSSITDCNKIKIVNLFVVDEKLRKEFYKCDAFQKRIFLNKLIQNKINIHDYYHGGFKEENIELKTVKFINDFFCLTHPFIPFQIHGFLKFQQFNVAINDAVAPP